MYKRTCGSSSGVVWRLKEALCVDKKGDATPDSLTEPVSVIPKPI